MTGAGSPEPYQAQLAVRLTGPLLAKRRHVHNGLHWRLYAPSPHPAIAWGSGFKYILNSFHGVSPDRPQTVGAVLAISPHSRMPPVHCDVVGVGHSADKKPGAAGKQIAPRPCYF